MISDDRNYGFGWTHNRSYYWYNLLSENSCLNEMATGSGAWGGVPHLFRPSDDDVNATPYDIVISQDYFEVRNLKIKQRYKVEFYNPQNNQLYFTSLIAKTDINGNLRIKIPVISNTHQDVAYKFRKLYTEWKNAESDSLFVEGKTIEPDSSGFEKISDIVVSPNPISSEFVVNSNNHQIDYVLIYDNQGRLIKTIDGKQNNTVNCSIIGEIGIYYLHIYIGDAIYLETILKE